MEHIERGGSKQQRLTIGLLSENATFDTESLLIQGAIEAAESHDANLVYFGYLEGSSEDNFSPWEHAELRHKTKHEGLPSV